MVERKIRKAVLAIFMLLAIIQTTGCESYESGAALLNDAIDAIKRVAGLSDGIADNQQTTGEEGITIELSGNENIATIEIEEENPENSSTEDITEESDTMSTSKEEPELDAESSEFESVAQDPDAS